MVGAYYTIWHLHVLIARNLRVQEKSCGMTNKIYHLRPGVWKRFIFILGVRTVMGDLESLIDVNIEG